MTYDSVYRAVVTRTDDPEAKQRLRLRVPVVLGDGETAWALPLQKVSVIPSQGDTVWVFFENGDLTQPVWAPGWLKEFGAAGSASITVDPEAPASPKDGAVWIDEDEVAVEVTADHNSLAGLTTGDPHTQYLLDADHDLAAHTTLGLSPDTHNHDADYVNEVDHTKAAHVALGLSPDDHAHTPQVKRWSFSWGSNTTATLADADGLVRAGGLLISGDGDNTPGAALLSIYRSGTYNVCAAVSTGGWSVGSTGDPGSGQYRVWVDGNTANAPLKFSNVGGASRTITVMQIEA